MTPTQERAITLSLNILAVGFFECTEHYFEYFINNDEWALLMAAANVNQTGTPPAKLALAVLTNAVARTGFFADMKDFKPPRHYCSFLKERVAAGEQLIQIRPCVPDQRGCPYATFDAFKSMRSRPGGGGERHAVDQEQNSGDDREPARCSGLIATTAHPLD